MRKNLEINEKNFESCLDTAEFEMLICLYEQVEIRLSNYLLCKMHMQRCFYTNIWPDFSVKELDDIILDFNKRQKKDLGGV